MRHSATAQVRRHSFSASSRIALVVTSLVLGAVAPVLVSGVASAHPAAQPDFIVTCSFSHRSQDDPIVEPGEEDASHSHDFFGNTSTAYDSTLSSLRAAGTTCDRATDTAAYWTPTVLQNGKPVDAPVMTIYYRNMSPIPTDIKTFPAGFRMGRWGIPMRPVRSGPKIVAWVCRQPNGYKTTWISPAAATPRIRLRIKVWFGDCWNGTSLDSPDHHSHVAYADAHGVCPPGYPVHIPQVAMTVRLNVPVVAGPPGTDGTAGRDPTISLSSGSALTGHGDFYNAWNQHALRSLVQQCLVKMADCPSPSTV